MTNRNSKKLKDDHINVRCTTQQKSLIETHAKRRGLGASSWMLSLCLEAIQREQQQEARS